MSCSNFWAVGEIGYSYTRCVLICFMCMDGKWLCTVVKSVPLRKLKTDYNYGSGFTFSLIL